MAVCKECGRWAGLFSSVHEVCANEAASKREANSRLINEWKLKLSEAMAGDAMAFAQLVAECRNVLPESDSAAIATTLLCPSVEDMVRRGARPTHAELEPLAALLQWSGLKHANLPGRCLHRFVMLAALADLAAGRFPDRCDDPQLGFAYERGERIAWVFGGVTHLEDKPPSRSGSSYMGVSLRVAPGFYVHTGGIKPNSDSVDGLVATSEGNLVVTDRALWYQGPHGIQRLWLDKVLAIQCLDDGFSFCMDGAHTRNQAFLTGKGEGWFVQDLLTQLRKFQPT